MTECQVGALRPGDRFVWAGRVVAVERCDAVRTVGVRPGRWLEVTEEDGTPHRIHYYDTEQVRLA